MELSEAARDGVLLTRDLSQWGLSPATILRLVRRGELHRLVRGAWLVDGSIDNATPPQQRAVALHRATTIALLSLMPGRVCAGHVSAAVLHGLPVWRASLDRVHLTRTGDVQSRHRPGAVIHEASGEPIARAGDWPAVSVADAVVGLGYTQAHHSPIDFLIAGDAALGAALTTPSHIAAAVARHAGRRGMSTVRLLQRHLDGRHESPGETRLGEMLRMLHVASTPQMPVTVEGHVYRVDRLLDEAPVAIEMDGLAKYGDSLDAVRRSLRAEKSREDDLRRAGFAVVRITWAMLDQPLLVQRLIRDAIALTRAGAVRPHARRAG